MSNAPRSEAGRLLALALALLAVLSTNASGLAGTLARIRQQRVLRCGTNVETPEYSTSDDHGPRSEFDGDLCRAVAVAILGPGAHIEMREFPDDVTAAAALRSGAVDLLPTQTFDLTHAIDPAFTLSRPTLLDGVGFLVPESSGIAHASELTGRKLCFLTETGVEVSLRAWFTKRHLKFVPFPFQEEGEMEAAFVTGNCDGLAGDMTRLASIRVGFGPVAGRYQLLGDVVSRDPLAAATRSDDPEFSGVVGWALELLLHAEAAGLTREAVRSASTGQMVSPALQRLAAETRDMTSRFSLDANWAVAVVGAVGSYAEIYERDLGSGSPLKLPRGINRLQEDGGEMAAVPFK